MNENLCKNCGAPLSEGSAFCTKCGSPVKQENATQADDVIQKSEASSAEQSTGQAASAKSTANPFLQSSSSQRTTQGLSQSAPAQPTANPFVQPASAQQTTQGLNQPASAQPPTNTFAQSAPPAFGSTPGQSAPAQAGIDGNNKRLIIILAVIVVVGLAIVLFSITRCSASNNANTVGAAVSGASSSTSLSSSQNSSTSAGAALSPEKQNAVAIYEEMAELDARISACATEFNENYLKPDRALRESYAKKANEVYLDAITLQTRISAMSTGGAKELGEDTGNLRSLDGDLVRRIQVIDESWKRSLEFSDPAPHENYIIAPIVADNEGGTNKYYKHFKDNYPNWNPLNT